jgi:hypothetical protein
MATGQIMELSRVDQRFEVAQSSFSGLMFSDCLVEGITMEGVSAAEMAAAYRQVQSERKDESQSAHNTKETPCNDGT